MQSECHGVAVKPVAAYTVDLTGCEHLSRDVAGIERIAAAGATGPTQVIYLYAAPPASISADAVVEACAKVADAEAAFHNTGSGFDSQSVYSAATDIATAIRALKGTFPAAPEAKSEVKVKALEWDDNCPTASVAVTPFCRYVVWPDGALSGHGKTQYLGSVPSAKAAAQADYETRLRSALVDPEGGV